MDRQLKSVKTASSERASWVAWWQSDWGPGPLLGLALPLMISAGFVSLTLFTDRTLLYWHSEVSASAAMGGGVIYWSIICLPMGMLGYLSTFVSQYRGAQHVDRIGSAYQHAMRLAWMLVPCLLCVIVAAPSIFAWSGHTGELAALETSYLRILLIGGVGVLFYSVQSGLLTGKGRTKTVLLFDGIATAVNLLLDAVLIFGFGPIPAMGILGAAIATTFSFWLKIPLAHWCIHRDRELVEDYQLRRRAAWEPAMLKRLVIYGAPAGLQMLAEAGCFSVIMLQVGKLGELQMAATTLALGLNVLAFVPIMGLGIGVGVLVGRHLTENRIDLARRTVWCAIAVSCIYTGVFAILFSGFSDAMLAIYALGTPAERFDQIRPMILPLLQIISIYCILDGLQVVFVGAIKGAGDTWFVLAATFFVSVSAIIVGVLCQWYFGASLMLWWYVIAGWIASMVAVFAGRYASGVWEAKRVIEKV